MQRYQCVLAYPEITELPAVDIHVTLSPKGEPPLVMVAVHEVGAFLSKYRLTQKQASQITGLGEKNISRWLTGRSRPSESVSNFLRLLLADESAFKRLRQKNFGAGIVSLSE